MDKFPIATVPDPEDDGFEEALCHGWTCLVCGFVFDIHGNCDCQPEEGE